MKILMRVLAIAIIPVVLTACSWSPPPTNTSQLSVAPVGNEIPFVKTERYMRTGHKPVTPTEFEANPFANFESEEAANAVVNLTGLALGIDNFSRDRFTRIVRGEDHEVERRWGDCSERFTTVSQNMQWFNRDRYETTYGVEQCLYLKGPGDRGFKAVFSLGCHNPIGAEIVRIIDSNDDDDFKRPPPETCEELGNCPPPPTCEDLGTCPPPPTCEDLGTCPPPPTCEDCQLRHGISFVMYTLEDGTTVKIDGYRGDVKDPTDPQQYIADIEDQYGQDVTGYVIKAGRGYYDENGDPVDPISHKADEEITQDDVVSNEDSHTAQAEATAAVTAEASTPEATTDDAGSKGAGQSEHATEQSEHTGPPEHAQAGGRPEHAGPPEHAQAGGRNK